MLAMNDLLKLSRLLARAVDDDALPALRLPVEYAQGALWGDDGDNLAFGGPHGPQFEPELGELIAALLNAAPGLLSAQAHLRSADRALNAEGPGRGGAVTASDLAWARRELAAALGQAECGVDHSDDDADLVS